MSLDPFPAFTRVQQLQQQPTTKPHISKPQKMGRYVQTALPSNLIKLQKNSVMSVGPHKWENGKRELLIFLKIITEAQIWTLFLLYIFAKDMKGHTIHFI